MYRVAISCSLMEMDNNWLQMLWKQPVMQNYCAVVAVELCGVLSAADTMRGQGRCLGRQAEMPVIYNMA